MRRMVHDLIASALRVWQDECGEVSIVLLLGLQTA